MKITAAIEDLLQSDMEAAPNVKPMINIGALMDIPTGRYMVGKWGESILNGGLAILTGIVGIGNQFKSTLEHYMLLVAMSRMAGSKAETYDTEINIHEWHLAQFAERIFGEFAEDVIASQRWKISDKTMHTGTEYYEIFKTFLERKIKNLEKIMVDSPFLNRDGSNLLQMPLPTFSEIDSFTEFETDDVIKMQDANELGDSGANTIFMRQGLAKARLLLEAPRLNSQAGNYLIMTAHLGKESTMQNAGPAGQVPVQMLKHLKNGDKIMGVTRKFTFITHNCWNCYNSNPLMAEDKKGPYYPRGRSDKVDLDTDLNTVQIRNLRSKSGPSGMALTLIVSQEEGVLPSLTEFHFIKENGRWGLSGNNTSYALDLLPEVTLQRTTVRGKIDEDKVLRRALNITSEMLQFRDTYRSLEEYHCTPKELYDDLKAKGYDWNVLLNTRGWWTYDNDQQEQPFLSTMDLLRMRKGQYVPYWMKPEDVPAGAKNDPHIYHKAA